ncbi:sensor histidine kinase [Pedobacter psychroterrae]|nr:histidine kinase [Pedobacter psychroterrae]
MKPFDWTILFIKPYKIYTHVVFWLLVSFAIIFFKEYPERMTGLTMICLVVQVTLEFMIPCYSQNLLVVPFFKKRGWLWGTAAYLLQVGLLIFLLPYVLNAVGMLFPITDRVDWRNEHVTFSVVTFTLIATIYKVALDGLILDKKRKENELMHLKAQLNPHFLFNTLNNLYGLSVAESKKLPGLMLRLSELLRYSLYDTNQSHVPLKKELDYITNYVELEKIRLSDKTDIKMEVAGSTTDLYIAPLLLIIFIENGFKHVSHAKDRQSYVHIMFRLNHKFLQLEVKNSIDPDYSPVKSESKEGLGLNNVKQRLDLIYPQQYSMSTTQENDCFDLKLEIELS